MSLWDKLKGALGRPAPAGEPEVEVRRHHYDFAHRAIPQIAFGNVDRFLFDLDHDATRLLNGIWGFVGQKLREAGLPTLEATLAPVQRLQLQERSVWIATLPTARATTEAALIAFVRGPKGGSTDEQLQYFTLEYGRDLQTGTPYHVLCQWNSEGNHLNSGDVLPPTVEALAAALSARLTPRTSLN